MQFLVDTACAGSELSPVLCGAQEAGCVVEALADQPLEEEPIAVCVPSERAFLVTVVQPGDVGRRREQAQSSMSLEVNRRTLTLADCPASLGSQLAQHAPI